MARARPNVLSRRPRRSTKGPLSALRPPAGPIRNAGKRQGASSPGPTRLACVARRVGKTRRMTPLGVSPWFGMSDALQRCPGAIGGLILVCLAFSPAALGSLYLLFSTPCQLLRPPRRPPGSDPGVQRVSARSSMMTSVAAGVLASVRVHPTRLDESTARALVGRAALCFHQSARNHVV